MLFNFKKLKLFADNLWGNLINITLHSQTKLASSHPISSNLPNLFSQYGY